MFDFFSGKAKTRIYNTFLGWLLVFHIDILFIAIFTDQAIIFEKTKLLKGEYLWSYITHFGWWTIAIETTRIVSAIVVTYLMIWVIPKLMSERSYKEELRVEYILRKMKLDKEEILNKREEVVAKQELKNIETERKVVTERAKLENTPEEVRWDSDFSDFMKVSNSEDSLLEISNTVYAEGGNLYQYKDVAGWVREPSGVSADNLALADTNGLVTVADKGKMLSLTNKGKYFIKKYRSM